MSSSSESSSESNTIDVLIAKHNAETFKIKKLKFCEKKGVLGYTTVNYKFKPLDNILALFDC
jgi:hypothetical protein